MSELVEEYKSKHLENYKTAIGEIIKNNTHVLFDEDVMTLIRKPPLDSMDLIKSKMLSLAKKYNIVINIFPLEESLKKYRATLMKECDGLKNIRSDELIVLINKWKPEKNLDIFKLNKADFVGINKKIKTDLKKIIVAVGEEKLLTGINDLFSEDVSELVKSKVIEEFSKYVLKSFPKQLIENLEIKIMIKDTTLINVIKEQGERYLFTLNNSRILNDESL